MANIYDNKHKKISLFKLSSKEKFSILSEVLADISNDEYVVADTSFIKDIYLKKSKFCDIVDKIYINKDIGRSADEAHYHLYKINKKGGEELFIISLTEKIFYQL